MSKQSLAGSRVVARSEPCRKGEKWRGYVLVAYPQGHFWRNFLTEASKSAEFEERIRETKSYQEITQKVRRYNPEDHYKIEQESKHAVCRVGSPSAAFLHAPNMSSALFAYA